MSREVRIRLAITGLVLSLAITGCVDGARGPAREDAGAVAARIFVLASGDPDPETLGATFDPEIVADRSVALLDALDGLPDSAVPEQLAVRSSDVDGESFVDFAVPLPGGGRAAYRVKLRRLEDGDWRVTWFQGPGVEWPSRGRRGDSLSTSAPP